MCKTETIGPEAERLTEYRRSLKIARSLKGDTRKSYIESLIGGHSQARDNHIPFKKEFRAFYTILPTIFDIAETMCSNIALTLLAASIT